MHLKKNVATTKESVLLKKLVLNMTNCYNSYDVPCHFNHVVISKKHFCRHKIQLFLEVVETQSTNHVSVFPSIKHSLDVIRVVHSYL